MDKLPIHLTQHRAVISKCGAYRYCLSRDVSPTSLYKPIIFIMLNPSTADAEQDDPTIRRCIDFTKRWDGSHLIVVNLFAYRSTQPSNLWHKDTVDPIGALNDKAINRAVELVHAHDGVIVAAWGNDGAFMQRGASVLKGLSQYNIQCLKINKSGNPAHPLYQPKFAKLISI